MRWTHLPLALLAVSGLAVPAVGFQPTWVEGSGYAGPVYNHAYCAPACGASFCGLVPGCCEFPPSACENAWVGYCEERAKWKAFWYRVGVPGTTSCSQPTAAWPCPPDPSQPMVQPSPATSGPPTVQPLPPVPAEPSGPAEPPALPPVPPPDAASGHWTSPWSWPPTGQARPVRWARGY